MRKILETCPGCGSELDVTQLSRTECDIVISGRFTPTRFNRLSPENLHFAELFIRLRGNIKDMERELGISYPTVRSRLNEVIQELGFEAEEEEILVEEEADTEEHRAVLTRLEQGELNVQDAVKLIRKGGKE